MNTSITRKKKPNKRLLFLIAVSFIIFGYGIFFEKSLYWDQQVGRDFFLFRSGRSTSTEKDDRRVNGSANDIPVAATIVPKIKVDFYGGSISNGSGLHNSRNRFTDIIGEELKQVELQNKAIGGAGAQHWLHCGIQPVDVIVSEFRINERNTRVLEEWYMMTSKFAQHTVVLDLWSWLTPPHIISAAELALHNLKKKFPHVNQTFSILSLSNRDKDVWREKVPGFFNYTDTHRPISEKCYANVLESDQEDAGLKRWCTRAHANEMQHGRESYHRDVSSSLAKHMKDHVLPFISLGETPSSETERLCIGSWGWGAFRDVDQFNETLIVGETTFQFSSPLSKRKDKLTLNTNSTSSTVRLDCPAPYNSMTLGHIVHSDLEESAIFEVNGKNISTHDHLEERPHIRIRKYTEQSFKTPLDISISSLHPGAYLELTDVVCKKENVTGSD